MWFLLTFAACVEPECTVAVSDVHTVLEAEITTPRPEQLRVSWEADGRTGATPLEAEASTSHRALLVDLAPLTDVVWRVLDADDEEVCAGESATANLPSGTPPFHATPPDDDLPPYWLVTMTGARVGELESRVGLFRADGTWIWSYVNPQLDAQVISADLTADGVRFNQFDADRQVDISSLQTIGLDGAIVASERTTLAHHFYTPLEDGAVAYLRADARITDPHGCVVGDTIVERSPDGTERPIWSAWDEMNIVPSGVWESGFYPGCKDWTHGSGLTWRASDDTLLVTLLGAKQIIHVDRKSGATLDTFGNGASMPAAPGSPPLQLPHNARWSADGHLLVFDSHEVPLEESGCYAYAVDRTNRAIVNDRRWIDGQLLGLYLGGVNELDDGRILCTWASDGVVRVFEREDPVPTYELRVDGLFQFGSVSTFDALPGLE